MFIFIICLHKQILEQTETEQNLYRQKKHRFHVYLHNTLWFVFSPLFFLPPSLTQKINILRFLRFTSRKILVIKYVTNIFKARRRKKTLIKSATIRGFSGGARVFFFPSKSLLWETRKMKMRKSNPRTLGIWKSYHVLGKGAGVYPSHSTATQTCTW